METHTYPHFPSGSNTIHLSVWHEVTNSDQIKQNLISVSKLASDSPEQQSMNFAFIDGKNITSRDQLLNACHLAIIAAEEGNMKTKTLHSEVLWNLMPGSNISESLKKIGISSTTSTLILVQITDRNKQASEVLTQMQNVIGTGTSARLSPNGLENLSSTTDWKSVQKLFKLDDAVQEGDIDSIVDAQKLVASLTAIKNVAA
ncbi:unnamed protein product [Sympodiomycopsis kandeliae]